METGTIVLSKAGRDKGRLLAVIDIPQENFRLIADGKLRRLETPKNKKLMHLQKVGFSEKLAELIKNGELTNNLLRKELALFDKSDAEK